MLSTTFAATESAVSSMLNGTKALFRPAAPTERVREQDQYQQHQQHQQCISKSEVYLVVAEIEASSICLVSKQVK